MRRKKVEGEKAGCERRGRLCAILTRGPNARGRLGRRRMKEGREGGESGKHQKQCLVAL